MSSVRTLNENLALRMLARNGIAIIWQLNVAAATAHRTGPSSIRGGASRGRCRGKRMASSRGLAEFAIKLFQIFISLPSLVMAKSVVYPGCHGRHMPGGAVRCSHQREWRILRRRAKVCLNNGGKVIVPPLKRALLVASPLLNPSNNSSGVRFDICSPL